MTENNQNRSPRKKSPAHRREEETPNHLLSPEEHRAKQEEKKALKQAKQAKAMERLSQRPSPNTFVGKHKWLGGAVDHNTGNIYGIPSHSIEVICISPPSSNKEQAKVSCISLPNMYKEGPFKWLRGIFHEGYLYGIPAWSTQGVLKVRLQPKNRHTRGPRVKLLPLPSSSTNEEKQYEGPVQSNHDAHGERWMWHGGALASCSDGDAIYCIPSNAQHVLKVHLASERVTAIGPSLTNEQNKWYGGIQGRDGCIYGMPYTATGVLRINPKTDTVQVLGDYPRGGYKWHGGLLAPSTGVIYAFPAHAQEVLCVDTNVSGRKDDSWRVSTIPIHCHANDRGSLHQHYKWLGGSHGADGCIYGMPSDATSILRIDPLKNEAATFGNVSPLKNKWQGGVLSPVDNCVYAMPADMDCILKIDTDPDTALAIETIGAFDKTVSDKWQGGFVAKDGRIYAIPENMNHVLVITPQVEGEALVEMIV